MESTNTAQYKYRCKFTYKWEFYASLRCIYYLLWNWWNPKILQSASTVFKFTYKWEFYAPLRCIYYLLWNSWNQDKGYLTLDMGCSSSQWTSLQPSPVPEREEFVNKNISKHSTGDRCGQRCWCSQRVVGAFEWRRLRYDLPGIMFQLSLLMGCHFSQWTSVMQPSPVPDWRICPRNVS